MFILQEALAAGHIGVIMCKRGSDWKCPRLAAAATWEADVKYFRTQGRVIERVETFKYPTRLLLSDNSGWPEVTRKLSKACWKWGGFSHILVCEGSDPQTFWRFYIAVVQYVLIFGSDMCLVMSRILRAVGILRSHAAVRIYGKMPQMLRNRGWQYPPIRKALSDAVLEIIGLYFTHIHNTVLQ